MDAYIESWDLPRLLEQIATATGWQVYLEPGAEQPVSAKFKDLPVPEALRYLLGKLNYALLPQTNGVQTLLVFETSLHGATKLIRAPESNTKTSKPIPNELVVKLKPGSKESIDDLAKRLGAKVIGKAEGLHAYRLLFENEAAANAARDLLASEPDIASVDNNYMVDRPPRADSSSLSSAPPSYPLKLKLGGDGSSLIVGLIDTPVQTLGHGMDQFLMPSVHVAGDPAYSDSQPMHGTSMAETLLEGLSVAQRDSESTSVRILPVDVYGKNPTTTSFDIANGIYSAVSAGARIVNLSLGGGGESPFLHDLIQQATQQGVLFVGAAGNDPTTTPTYPAAYPEVLAVTAGDRKGDVASYANRGDFVDVVAPGTSIVYFGEQAFLVSGTSTATAYVSGLAAGIAASTGKPLAEVEAQLKQTLHYSAGAKTSP